jgi:hypothetical protein
MIKNTNKMGMKLGSFRDEIEHNISKGVKLLDTNSQILSSFSALTTGFALAMASRAEVR